MAANKKWPISMYAWWVYEKTMWQVAQVDPKARIQLSVKGTQVLLVHKRTALESFSLIQKPGEAGVWLKNLSMAVVVRNGDKYRKFKMLFESKKDAAEALQCFRKHIVCKEFTGRRYSDGTKEMPEHPSSEQRSENTAGISVSRSQNSAAAGVSNGPAFPEMLIERIMSKSPSSLPAPEPLPADYPLESAVRLCILDPSFPSLVDKVENIIKKYQV